MATARTSEEILDIVNFLELGLHYARAYHHPSGPPLANSQQPQLPPGVSAEDYHHGPLEYPPGLVRISSPVPAPVRVITNDDVSLFGDFAQYLDTGRDEDGNLVAVDLDCLICQDRKLQLPACVTANNPDLAPGLEGPRWEWMAILPCGHFWGSDCLLEWLSESTWTSPENCASCPLCRLTLTYNCGHFLSPRDFHPARTRAEQVPMTLPERGAVPERCAECHYKEVAVAVERLRNLLFPRDLVPTDLVRPETWDFMKSASIDFCTRMWAFAEMDENYNRW
ncbi:hypothetical protein F5Y14DRAFT_294712 [Nemania sp. NC0429]|nr:hypothetical protein F5Y14DRAFT_294712 [Nemania sp. NC0429]